MKTMNTTIAGKGYELIPYIMISISTLICCFLSIYTGIIYPVAAHEQQLLKSWGLWGPQYIGVLLGLLLISTAISTAITIVVSVRIRKIRLRKPSSTNEPEIDGIFSLVTSILLCVLTFLCTSTFAGLIVFGNLSLYYSSVIIDFISLFITVGVAVGATIALSIQKFKDSRNSSIV